MFRSLFKKIEQAIATLTTVKEGFVDELKDLNDGSINIKATQAYEKLDLHPRISNAASELFKNKHYSNAIEAGEKIQTSPFRTIELLSDSRG